MLTEEDYDIAIAVLKLAKTQLTPDGHNCVICWDNGHQAWECRFNPLSLMFDWIPTRKQIRQTMKKEE